MSYIVQTGTNESETFIPEDGENFINGNGGTDRVDYSTTSQNIRATLHETGTSSVYIGDLARDILEDIDDITGGSGDDHITGDESTNKFKGGPGRDFLDGGEGLDFAEYNEKTDSISVNLSQNGDSVVFVNGAPEDTLRNIENIISGSGNDHIVGTEGYNMIFGGPGDDIIEGKGLVDAIYGGPGADTYTYRTFQDSALYYADWINDFDRSQGDKFDFSMIDADISKDGQQVLAFSGDRAPQAHSIWYGCQHYALSQDHCNVENDTWYQYLYADVNGDTDADFSIIVVDPLSDFIITDFIL